MRAALWQSWVRGGGVSAARSGARVLNFEQVPCTSALASPHCCASSSYSPDIADASIAATGASERWERVKLAGSVESQHCCKLETGMSSLQQTALQPSKNAKFKNDAASFAHTSWPQSHFDQHSRDGNLTCKARTTYLSLFPWLDDGLHELGRLSRLDGLVGHALIALGVLDCVVAKLELWLFCGRCFSHRLVSRRSNWLIYGAFRFRRCS